MLLRQRRRLRSRWLHARGADRQACQLPQSASHARGSESRLGTATNRRLLFYRVGAPAQGRKRVPGRDDGDLRAVRRQGVQLRLRARRQRAKAARTRARSTHRETRAGGEDGDGRQARGRCGAQLQQHPHRTDRLLRTPTGEAPRGRRRPPRGRADQTGSRSCGFGHTRASALQPPRGRKACPPRPERGRDADRTAPAPADSKRYRAHYGARPNDRPGHGRP